MIHSPSILVKVLVLSLGVGLVACNNSGKDGDGDIDSGDGGGTDGGGADGGGTDGGGTDGGGTDGGGTDGGGTDGGGTDGGGTDGGGTDGGGTDGGGTDGGGTDGGGTDGGGTDGGGTDGGGTDGGGTDGGGTDGGGTGDPDLDGDGYTVGEGDCDDGDDRINPGAIEVCDDIDNNCNDRVDEGVLDTFFLDSDGDGFGVATDVVEACEPPDGYAIRPDDCDDANPLTYPDAEEVCDAQDNDCDDEVDEDIEETAAQWRDADGDGFGDIRDSVEDCAPVDGYVYNNLDCDDADELVNPDAAEFCDGIDNDCDRVVDEDDAVDARELAVDADADGFGDPGTSELRCDGVPNELDCDDGDPTEPQVVDLATTASPDGTVDAPWPTIQAGIDEADQCVVVAPGTYEENLDFHGKGVSVISVAGAPTTIIDGRGAGPVVTFGSGEGPDAELRGFTLTNGSGHNETATETVTDDSGAVDHYIYYVTSCGGGLFIDGAEPTLTQLILRGNVLANPDDYTDGDGNEWYFYSYGGGACVRGTNLALESVDLIGNEAGDGGGLFVDSTSRVELWKSIVTSNAAISGGGIQVDGGQLTLRNVVSSWNEAEVEGGGLLVIDGALAATNVTMGRDEAPSGGALYLATDSVGSVGVLMNSIIAQAGDGEGVLVDGSSGFTGTYNDVYGNVGGDYSGTSDPTGTSGNISANPLFTDVSDDGTWTNDNWTLRATSPAIDAGDPASGYNDSDGTRNDMGAYGGPDSAWAP